MCNLQSKTPDELVAAYIHLRQKKAELEAKQKEEMAPMTAALDAIEEEVHQRLNAMGVSSIKVKDVGTAYTKRVRSVKVFDKAMFMDYIKNNSAFDLLDVRANKTAVEDYISQYQDLPPGLTSTEEESVGFRKA